jgi:hypothetical protein
MGRGEKVEKEMTHKRGDMMNVSPGTASFY